MYKEELSIIAQAVLNEVEGYEFYKMASEQAGNEKTKEAWLELANEELKHAEFLRKLWTKLSNGGDLELDSIIESGIVIPSPEIYRWDKVDKTARTVAMSIFGLGMQMEQSSIEFYEKSKEKLKSKVSRDLFELLISWEKVHLDQFTQQYSNLKEEWWSEQGFAPF